MPPMPYIANVVKLEIEGTCEGHPWANVFHWAYSGAVPDTAAATAMASALLSAWVTNFAPLMDDRCTIDTATCTDLASGTGAFGTDTASSPGSRVGLPIPASLCVLQHKTIPRRYRGGHPRSYLHAGVQADLFNPTAWTTALQVAVNGAYAAVVAALDGLVSGATTFGAEVIVSYIDKLLNPVKPYLRAVPLAFPVTAYSTEQAIATQRRRLGR